MSHVSKLVILKKAILGLDIPSIMGVATSEVPVQGKKAAKQVVEIIHNKDLTKEELARIEEACKSASSSFEPSDLKYHLSGEIKLDGLSGRGQ